MPGTIFFKYSSVDRTPSPVRLRHIGNKSAAHRYMSACAAGSATGSSNGFMSRIPVNGPVLPARRCGCHSSGSVAIQRDELPVVGDVEGAVLTHHISQTALQIHSNQHTEDPI